MANAGGGEAQQEAVQREVVEAAARQCKAIVLLVAALAVTTPEISQPRRIMQGFGERRSPDIRHRRLAERIHAL